LTSLCIVLAEQTSRCIESVDLILREVQARISVHAPHTPEEFHQQMSDASLHQFLTSRLQNLPQAGAIALVDSDGMRLSWLRIMMR
jgi:hypothetical protein